MTATAPAGPALIAQRRRVERLAELPRADREGEALVEEAPRLAAHALAQPRVGAQRRERARERGRIARAHRDARAAVAKQVGDLAAVGSDEDHRAAGREDP